MKQNTKNIIILCCILLLLLLIFQNSMEVKQNIIKSTELFLTQVFPSLFPMFIISSLLTHYHFPELLANKFGRIFTNTFHTTSYGIFAFFMSLISGTPSSAFIIKNLLQEQKINEQEASYLLSFTFFSNPLFLLNILFLIFQDHNLVLKIILIHYSVNLIIGFLLRPKKKKTFQKITYANQTNSLGTNLSIAIKNSLDTLLLILGTISFYFMISNLIPIQNPILKTITSGLLELTQGLSNLINCHTSLYLKKILAISFISFGGLSIHTQIQSIIKSTNISYQPFLKGRILHVIFSMILITIF